MSNADADDIPGSEEPLETLVSKSGAELGAPDERPETVERTREILSLYLKDISKVKLLTAEQEQDLARRVQAGDEQAQRELVEANLRLVVRIARRYGLGALGPRSVEGEAVPDGFGAERFQPAGAPIHQDQRIEFQFRLEQRQIVLVVHRHDLGIHSAVARPNLDAVFVVDDMRRGQDETVLGDGKAGAETVDLRIDIRCLGQIVRIEKGRLPGGVALQIGGTRRQILG